MRNIFTAFAASLMMAPIAFPAHAFEIDGNEGTVLSAEELAKFNAPWAMTFLPDGRMLVSEKGGKIFLVSADGSSKISIKNLPKADVGGQGGMGDVIPHPDFAKNAMVYFSYAEAGNGNTRGATVARSKLVEKNQTAIFEDVEIIWRQTPKVTGRGHYGHKMAFGPDGKLFITSSDRQKLDPAQDFDSSLGKIIRLNEDGSVPDDNPWQDKGELAKSFWSMGHRNMLGIDFDSQGDLWINEMGPAHGDEFNLVIKGENYGWPAVSEGNHYSGAKIPNHDTQPQFKAPKEFWIPSIAPAGLEIYDGELFEDWQGDALMGGLRGQALIHVEIEGDTAGEAERFEWNQRIREVEQGPDGAVYVLEDGRGGRLLRLTPAD